MPELPEVETVVRVIRPLILEKVITDARFSVPRQLLPQTPQQVRRGIQKKRISKVERKGKFILVYLEEGLLLIHLRMTGRLYIKKSTMELGKHERACFTLDDGNSLIFNDPRTLGTISYHKQQDEIAALVKLGWDPLTDQTTVEELRESLRGRTTAIKKLLLDQTIWAGIGNIYASEILWMAGIHPEKQSNLLTKHQLTALIEAVPLVLKHALEKGGSTLRDFMSPDGKRGGYSKEFRVYDREGEPCLRCKKLIKRIVQAQRSTYFCPGCQKKR
ncbi:bifunctional DNA-formamidopyrimidine glycosylase/DNA-(apurinic or apyrimidinic site) lyase [bacterium]|nr:bifunctional DNA-formamidopyrimidine glycosylase/DNA-(apurinic or apyrimidinic site) lyase [bacterium]